MNLIFFTDHSTEISKYCLLNIKNYSKISYLDKKMYFIDPSVYELKNKSEYSKINELHELANSELPLNQFLSIDYPCDMNLGYENEFIEKSIANNKKYAKNTQYIATIQFKFKDFKDFEYRTQELFSILKSENTLDKKIIGIGNLCRIFHKSDFTEKTFSLLRKLAIEESIHWFHFYGLGIKLITQCCEYFKDLDITISIDSTKWTKRINKNGVLANAICCRKDTRNAYFLEYMKEIEKRTGITPIF